MRLGERGPYLHDSGWAVLPLSAPLAAYHIPAAPDPFAEILPCGPLLLRGGAWCVILRQSLRAVNVAAIVESGETHSLVL